MTDDPYAVLAELVEYPIEAMTHQLDPECHDGWVAACIRARALVAAHRAGQRTEHRPDLIDRDRGRWVWVEGYVRPGVWGVRSRERVEKVFGPVTEAGPAETEDPS